MTPMDWKGLRKFVAREPMLEVLRLIRSENVGPVTFFNLIYQYGSARAALEAIPTLASKGGRKKPIALCSVKDAEAEMKQVEKAGARLLRFGEEDYPLLLTTIYDPPPVITLKGFAHLWQKPTCLAIVGARNASASGFQFARKLAADAGGRGITVISGLARGIDTAAHQGSLATGTVAVMASSIDQVYPPENRPLYDAISAQGAVITEQPFGASPLPRSFPARNRIISGMTHATVIVEASLKSGSLITARMALEQGREVLAVPGSPLDPRCRGTNGLLKEGASVCESIDDVLAVLRREPMLPLGEQEAAQFVSYGSHTPSEAERNEARRLVAEKLSHTPVAVDELLVQCHLTPNLLSLVLLEMELAGRLTRHPGHHVSLGGDMLSQVS